MHISRSIVLEANARKVLEVVKGPEGWADWHPDIKVVEPVDYRGKHLLRVVFQNGDSVIERSLGADGMSFGYEVVAGQSSMTGYQGSFTVIEIADQSIVIWNVAFEPLASGCYEAIAVDFMEVGLTALAQRFST